MSSGADAILDRSLDSASKFERCRTLINNFLLTVGLVVLVAGVTIIGFLN